MLRADISNRPKMDHFCICDSIYRFKTEFAGTLDGMIFNFHDGRPGLSRKWHYHDVSKYVSHFIILELIPNFFYDSIIRKYLCWRWNWAFNDEWKIQFNLRKLRIVFKLIILSYAQPEPWRPGTGPVENKIQESTKVHLVVTMVACLLKI